MIPRGETLDQKRPASLLESASKEVTTPTRKVRVRTSYFTAARSRMRVTAEEIWDRHQHDADRDQRDDVRNEIGIDDERDAAEQWARARAVACRRAQSPRRWSRTTVPTAAIASLMSPTSCHGADAPYWLSLWTRKLTSSTSCVGAAGAPARVTRYLPLTTRSACGRRRRP